MTPFLDILSKKVNILLDISIGKFDFFEYF